MLLKGLVFEIPRVSLWSAYWKREIWSFASNGEAESGEICKKLREKEKQKLFVFLPPFSKKRREAFSPFPSS